MVIGNSWASCTGQDGRRRLDDPKDWVRLEVAAALRRNVLVVPAFPICGGGDPRAVGKYSKRVSLLWVFHGAKDDVVPVQYSEMMVDALKKAGADIRFTVYPNVRHDSWVPAFAEADLLPWLFSHSRKESIKDRVLKLFVGSILAHARREPVLYSSNAF